MPTHCAASSGGVHVKSIPPQSTNRSTRVSGLSRPRCALAAERDWDQIELTDIADKASVTLLQLRDAFPSKGAILGGFARLIDKKVLSDSSG